MRDVIGKRILHEDEDDKYSSFDSYRLSSSNLSESEELIS